MFTIEELNKIVIEYMKSFDIVGSPKELYEPIVYSLDSGGKRIRPMLTLLACNIFSDEVNNALPSAAAIEVFHNFTLMHDDIMDNALVRRGKMSVYGKWGENAAILSGDAMIVYSYKLLQQTPIEYLPAVLGCYNHTALTVCEGQQMDMLFEKREDVTMGEYMEMVNKKTSALLAGATIIGAIQGGADNNARHQLFIFATELGIAFQIQDDLLDSYGTEEKLGKRIGGDILEGKKTFLTITALSKASEQVRKELLSLLKDNMISERDKISRVLAIYDSLGVKEHTEREVESRFNKAIGALKSLHVDEERIEPMRTLAMSLMNRNK